LACDPAIAAIVTVRIFQKFSGWKALLVKSHEVFATACRDNRLEAKTFGLDQWQFDLSAFDRTLDRKGWL